MPKRRIKKYVRRRIALSILVVFMLAIVMGIGSCVKHIMAKEAPVDLSLPSQPTEQTAQVTTAEPSIPVPLSQPVVYPSMTEATATFDPALVTSEYGALLDVQGNTILAQRSGNARIYPASLTKVMTLLVAVEHITNLDETFTMTYGILAPLLNQDATRAGFEENEQVKLIDMLYGAILPSGADASIGLAEAISGTEAAFVTLMNEKAQAIGLKDTHFVNTSGLHDENHYTTAVDLAVIMKCAIQNELCRKILSTYQYTTSPTAQHPEGILLTSTMFSRMYGNEVENVTILGGKTGYVYESGHCLASFATKNGKEYIAVTTKGAGKYKPIYDSFEIYGKYIP